MRYEKWHSLDKDGRWLHNPYDIGGRSTDLLQLAYTLQHLVRENFPINEVPAHIAEQAKMLEITLLRAEGQIEAFIELVSDHFLDIQKEKK